MSKAKTKKTGGPRSWCVCGHIGDVKLGDDDSRSQHEGMMGHGACEIEGCDCIKFTFDRFIETPKAR